MKKLLFIILSIASCGYAFYSTYKMVYQNQAPFTIECLGVRLNPNKKYAISNSLSKSSDTLVINFPQGKGIMPDNLGYIAHNSSNNSFELKTGNEIILPFGESVNNPFWAFSRTSDEKLFQKPKYFEPNSTISADILTNNGVKFNSIVGDKFSRVSIKLFSFAGKSYLKTTSEGIGTQYPLQAGSANRISVICNQPIKTEHSKIFYFENTASDRCEYTIEITPSSTFNYSYKVLNQNREVVKEGNSEIEQFEVGDYLFKISPKYTTFDTAFLIISLLILFGFQIFFINSYAKSKAPPVKSIIAIRLLLNCFAFLSIPLYLIALTVTANRLVYLVLLLILNASYFTSKRFLHNFNFNLNKWWEIIIWLAAMVLPLIMYKFASDENLFGIPILHIQKLIILGLIFITQGGFLRKYRLGNWIRLALILSYTLGLSWITHDIGSFLYVTIAFLLVEIVKKSISSKAVVLSFLILASGIYLFYNVSDNTFADRKLYRIVAPYTSPDGEKLSKANQADRETYSYLHLIQKNLTEGSISEVNKLVIPASMRSTSFSDFAYFWSIIFGKAFFAVTFLLVQFLLLYELAFLLFISIRPIRINKNQTFILPINRESEFVRFLLAFAIVTFTYPVLSNLLLVPLTGQSFPCLSISLNEIIFLILFLIPISSIFTNPKYIQNTQTVNYSYFDVLGSLRFSAFILLSLFAIALTVKWFDIKANPGEYRWQKLNKETAEYKTEDINAADKASLIENAFEAIETDELTSVQKVKKPYLKNLASFYFLNKPYNQIHFESSYFENSSDAVINQMSLDSVFSIKRELVSGPHHPFGNVYSYIQLVNGKNRLAYTNDHYASIPQNAKSINGDLSAELSRELSNHIAKIGVPSNIGSILIVKNANGSVVANSTYPLISKVNSNEIHYNIGSIKKIILAYCALAIDPNYKHKIYNNRNFHDFIKWSDDIYAASLLKDIMLRHEQAFADILYKDFNLPLISQTEDGYFDQKPDIASYTKPLDKKNEIYRYSIGQQKPYQFIKVVEWYSRIASGEKVSLNYKDGEKNYEDMSLPAEDMAFLKEAMNSVLSGTAPKVGDGLSRNSIQLRNFIAKTGTAESASGQYNSSSSFIIANNEYTIGIMLNGRIPNNSQSLAAKDLLVSIIPVLKKYNVL
jgi:hypothetical protein